MRVDRRSAPAVRVYCRRWDVDVLECGHGVSTTELRRDGRWARLDPGLGFRRCAKCEQGAPIEWVIPSPGFRAESRDA